MDLEVNLPVEQDPDFHRLLQLLAEITLDGGFERALPFYELPVVVVRPTGRQFYTDAREFVREMEEIYHCHRSPQILAVTYEILGSNNFSPGLFDVALRWDFRDRNGQVQRQLFDSLVLIRRLRRYKIQIQIAHNEILERPFLPEAGED